MKKSLTLALAALAVVGLIAIFWFNSAQKQPKQSEASSTVTDTTQDSTTTTSSNSILAIDPNDIDSIEVTVGSKSLNYVHTNETWSIEGYENEFLDPYVLISKIKTMSNIEPLSVNTSAQLSDYGLDSPSKTATIHLADQTTITLSVGNLSSDQSAVYAMIDSEPSTIYVVNRTVYDAMIADFDSYKAQELACYSASAIYDVTIAGNEFENVYIKLSDLQNGVTNSYDVVTDLVNTSANAYSIELLKTVLPSLMTGTEVATEVTDLSIYGLDHPILDLTTSFYDTTTAFVDVTNNTSFFDIVGQTHYIFGNILDNGEIAYMKVGDSTVYSMDVSFLAPFKEYSRPFFLMSKYISIPHIKNVSTIDVAFEDISYHMTVDEANEKYTLSEKEMDKDLFKKLYRNICVLSAETEIEESSNSDSAVLTITYTMLDGNSQVSTFVPSSSEAYYETYLADAILVGVPKTQIDQLKATLKAAAAGEEFDDIY